MRIAYVGNFGPVRGSDTVRAEVYIARALRKLGHEVVPVQVPPYLFRRRISRLQADVVLVSHCRDMPRRWIEALPRENPGSLVVQWLFDVLSAEPFQRREREWFIPRAKVWHLSFIKERGRFEYYRSLGIACYWLQEAAPEFPFAERVVEEHRCDLAFVGNPHSPYRLEVVRQVQARGYRVHVYCHKRNVRKWREAGMKHVFSSVADETLGGVCGSAAFVLAVGVGPQDPEGYWSNRVYMTLAHGGLVLHQYVPGLEEHFEHGKHLLWWRDVRELLALLERYRDDEEARRRIRYEGWHHVRRYHTYESRCAELVEVCAAARQHGQGAVRR